MEKALEQQTTDCLRVAIYGPESTGKTTLSKSLAQHFNTEWVPEFARDYLQEKYDNAGKVCGEKDLLPIALGQMKDENRLAQKANRVLFCDTNLLETYAYGEAYYNNFNNPTLKEAAEKSHYDLYFLTYIDVPWEADDLRDRPDRREEMFEHFKAALNKRNIPYHLIKGNTQVRLKKAIETIENLLRNQD